MLDLDKIQTQGTYLQQLNEVQRLAVTTTEGPVLVVAGPGSGKTRVLTFRIAHLIEKGVAPWEILALTFTNKAAREMKDRIEKVVGARAQRVWAGTFHSIFARILRYEAEHIGYPSNFTIYDSDDTKSVLNAIIKEMNLNKEQYNTNNIRSRISSCKSNLITPKLYETKADLREEDRMSKRPYFYEIYKKYTARCKKSGAMDFDDLLFRLFELFQNHPEVADKYRKRFTYLMVDEFQDTNYLQYSIVKKFVNYEGSPRNICVVGDDAQSIYAFRGATIQNILDYEQDFKSFGIQTFKLEQNYRSTEHIVKAANEVISYNPKQIKKTIISEKGDGQRIKVIKAMTDSEEGKRVASFIVEQKNREHLSNNEIAILYRTNSQSRVFEEWLRNYNIPYRVFGGLSFYQRKEVKDMIAYMRLAINQRDEEALRRVINYPRRGIGDTTIEKISAFADQSGKTMWEALFEVPLPARTKSQIGNFIRMIQDFIQKAQVADAHTVGMYIAKQCGILGELNKDKTVEGMNRVENIRSLLDGIKTFVDNDVEEVKDEVVIEEEEDLLAKGPVDQFDRSLSGYLQNIALMTDLDESNSNDDFVTLMSVHAAKGLEFKSVFVTGLEEQLFPSFMSMDTPEGLDEERRLFYVAITRAEQFLTLTYANSRYRFGQERFNSPSRFLDEIEMQHLDVAVPIGKKERTSFGRTESGMGGSPQRQTSGVSGNFKQRVAQPSFHIDPKDFKPSPSSTIEAGQKVLHLKFGKGQVIAVDGTRDKRMATIVFENLETEQQKRIMLKFAKLQVLE